MSSEIDLKSVLGMVQRQAFSIFSLFVFITVLGVLFAYSFTPKYAGTALVVVESKPSNLLDPQALLNGGITDNARIESEVNIISSDGVLLDVVRSQNLISDDEFGVKL
ncbi:Chain length determinant protein, partial [Rhizobium sp. RU20A]|uniref:Wzz/FepE/Etk N-terminal domain-containing protein n=1 Tax=Rhizobium sp. RU20A TaxID=1907412 RepID=UPI000953CA0A